jgi:hypothetical protein
VRTHRLLDPLQGHFQRVSIRLGKTLDCSQ